MAGFRYPFDIQTALEPWRQELGASFNDVVATLSDRDRALEDVVTKALADIVSNAAAIAAGPACSGGIAFMATQSTTSTSYVTPNTSGATAFSFSFTKRNTATSLLTVVNGSSFASATGAISQIGYRINSTDIDIVNFFHNAGGRHDAWGGSRRAFTGLAAGTYTCNLRWKTPSGTINTDGNDLWTMTVLEVA